MERVTEVVIIISWREHAGGGKVREFISEDAGVVIERSTCYQCHLCWIEKQTGYNY